MVQMLLQAVPFTICLLHFPFVTHGLKKFSNCLSLEEEGKFWRELTADYDSESGPPGTVDVAVSVRVHSVQEIKILDGNAKISLNLRQQWADPRLAFKCNTSVGYLFGQKHLAKLWTPGVAITNTLAATVALPEGFYFQSPEDGLIFLSQHLYISVPCYANVYKFPFDTVRCEIRMASISKTGRLVNIAWGKENPLQQEQLSNLQEFYFVDGNVSSIDTARGTEPHVLLQVDLTFQRYVAYFILQSYLPNVLTVLVGWFALFLNPKTMHARSGFGISTLLAIILQYGNVLQNVPKVGYIKGIDVWMFGCLAFVVFTLIQYTILAYILHYNTGKAMDDQKVFEIDRFCRVGYIILYVLFVILYVTFFVI